MKMLSLMIGWSYHDRRRFFVAYKMYKDSTGEYSEWDTIIK